MHVVFKTKYGKIYTVFKIYRAKAETNLDLDRPRLLP